MRVGGGEKRDGGVWRIDGEGKGSEEGQGELGVGVEAGPRGVEWRKVPNFAWRGNMSIKGWHTCYSIINNFI